MATWWELSLITWRSLFLQDKARRCHGLWRLPAILRTVLRCPRKGLCRNVCRLHGVNGRGKKQILLIMGVTTAARKVTFTYSSLPFVVLQRVRNANQAFVWWHLRRMRSSHPCWCQRGGHHWEHIQAILQPCVSFTRISSSESESCLLVVRKENYSVPPL